MKTKSTLLSLILILGFSIINYSCIRIKKQTYAYDEGYRYITLAEEDSTINIEWKDFSSLQISGDFMIKYSQGDENSIVIKGDKAILDELKIDTHKKTLDIYTDNIRIKSDDKSITDDNNDEDNRIKDHISIIITTKKLLDIDISRNANLVMDGQFKNDDKVKIVCSGASSIENLNLTAPSLYIDLSGASHIGEKSVLNAEKMEIELCGCSNMKDTNIKANDLDLDVSGASSIESSVNIESNHLDLDVSGASNIKSNINIKDNIALDISGASKVNITGQTNNIVGDLSGASSLNIKNLKVMGKKNIDVTGSSSLKN